MELFFKKKKITLDQLSYSFVCETMDININGIDINLDETSKKLVKSITMLGSIVYIQLYISTYLVKNNEVDQEKISYNVGKSVIDSLFYWYKKQNMSESAIKENIDIMNEFYDDIFDSKELNSDKNIDEQIYLYINNRIFKELNINDTESVKIQGIIAEYTKGILNKLFDTGKRIFKKYEVVLE